MKKKKEADIYWSKINSIIFLSGILSIILGYIFLARGSLTLSPILLVLGYAILIPVSLIYKGWEKKEEDKTNP
ncbi:MAG: hypothetical protein ABIN61_00965 [candidate division WOR-3 bacterium]